jgi:hypothetical protein
MVLYLEDLANPKIELNLVPNYPIADLQSVRTKGSRLKHPIKKGLSNILKALFCNIKELF